MTEIIILGCGSASGVPSITGGWGVCDPNNTKNIRRRAGIYIKKGQTEILVDTSPDLRQQLLDNHIKTLNAVLYTHTHSDHLSGIDDLRGITRNMRPYGLNIYAIKEQIDDIRTRFRYVLTDETDKQITHHPELVPNVINFNKTFSVGDFTTIMPLKFCGHPVITTGYVFNKGEIVVIPDYKFIPPETLEYLRSTDVNLLIMPLTSVKNCEYHADMQADLDYIRIIAPKQTILTHMSPYCDYENIESLTPDNVHPAYDNLTIEL